MKHAAFAAALLDPEAALPDDVITRTGADAARRFGVYRNNAIVSLIDALADSYPVVAALVGDEFFRAMAREFARRHPPRSPIMAHYGSGFAAFIAGFAPAAALPYLADIARLEWQRVVSWHADDISSLEPEDIAPLLADPIAVAETRWRFHPSAALIEAHFAIVSLWSAHQQSSVGDVEAALAHVDPFLPESALVSRQGLDVLILNVAVAEAAFVRGLLAGHTLATAVGDAEKKSANFDLALMMGMLLRSGALAGFDMSPPA
jgi:hypothetical protein